MMNLMMMIDDISADSWFAIIYTVIAEITPVEIHGVTTAMFLFILNNIAGNLPVIVAPLSNSVGLRGALFIMSPMLVGVSKLSEIAHNLKLSLKHDNFRRNNLPRSRPNTLQAKGSISNQVLR